MALLFINKVLYNRQSFSDKVEEISDKLGILPDWLMFLMDFESEISSTRPNACGCVGLIQFCPDRYSAPCVPAVDYKTIGGRQYKISDIAAMSNVDQLNLVYEYLKPFKGDMQEYYDLYFAILFPNALGKEDSYIINTKSNPIFDLNKNGSITVAEVKQFLDNRVRDKVSPSYWNIFLKKKETFCRYIREKSYSGEQLQLA